MGLAVCAPIASAATLTVGPGLPLATPSQAAAVARDGDTVLIRAGTYRGDTATWTQNRLTLRATGGRVVLDAAGRSAQGKAIWVITGDRTRVEGITFQNARVPDRNGAGIRQEGARLLVLRCRFVRNQDGILSADHPRGAITIVGSTFVDNGAGDGYSHNLYVGGGRTLVIRGSTFARARVGHNIKSRAARTIISSSRILDRNGTTSYSVDIPDGGDLTIAGSVIQQGPRGQNPALISYAAESASNPGRRIRIAASTLVDDRPGGGPFLRTFIPANVAYLSSLLVGAGAPVEGARPTMRGTVRTRRPGFVNARGYDYRLRPGSPAVDRGVRLPRALMPAQSPGGGRRSIVGPRPDAGAFELGRR